MKRIYLILVVMSIISCITTKEPKEISVTRIEILPSGNSIVTTEYADSITVVNLNKEGELVQQLPDTTLLDTIQDSSFLYQ